MTNARSMARSLIAVATAAGIGLATASAFAQSEVDFYKGKTVRLVVGTSTGGGYDTYARMLQPYLEKKLGTTVIVENRPGGSHMVAMNYVYAAAAPDGLTLMLATGEGATLGTLLAEPGIRFDLTKYPILGRVNTAPRILILNPKLPYKTIQDIKASGKTLAMGFAGKTDGASDTATVLCYALKIPCKAIIGYPSSKEFTLAAIRGEVDGTVLTEDSAARFMQGGELRAIVVTGREKAPLAPDVPTIFEQVSLDAEAAWWLDFRDDLRKLGRIIVTTPGVPEARQEFLRGVVKDVVTDPATMKLFEEREMPLRYAPPSEIAAIIKNILGGNLSEERVKEIRYVITEKYH
ncbi:MAG: Bug family tripartite tricarboxylate transporter substrate binding protein [Alphaproteobacteria bacterium]